MTDLDTDEPSPPFELGGVHHLALVCSDMARTVDFYTNVLGMPLIKTIELPDGMGQHFFFDCGGGDSSPSSGSPTHRPPPPAWPARRTGPTPARLGARSAR